MRRVAVRHGRDGGPARIDDDRVGPAWLYLGAEDTLLQRHLHGEAPPGRVDREGRVGRERDVAVDVRELHAALAQANHRDGGSGAQRVARGAGRAIGAQHTELLVAPRRHHLDDVGVYARRAAHEGPSLHARVGRRELERPDLEPEVGSLRRRDAGWTTVASREQHAERCFVRTGRVAVHRGVERMRVGDRRGNLRQGGDGQGLRRTRGLAATRGERRDEEQMAKPQHAPSLTDALAPDHCRAVVSNPWIARLP